jgi:hypothetical protein
MLDRLPTEILLHILSLLPQPRLLELPPARDNPLHRICLVSKRLRTTAQSLLWRRVKVPLEKRRDIELNSIISPRTAFLAPFVRELYITSLDYTCPHVVGLIAELPELQCVQISNRKMPVEADELLPVLAKLPSTFTFPASFVEHLADLTAPQSFTVSSSTASGSTSTSILPPFLSLRP